MGHLAKTTYSVHSMNVPTSEVEIKCIKAKCLICILCLQINMQSVTQIDVLKEIKTPTYQISQIIQHDIVESKIYHIVVKTSIVLPDLYLCCKSLFITKILFCIVFAWEIFQYCCQLKLAWKALAKDQKVTQVNIMQNTKTLFLQ